MTKARGCSASALQGTADNDNGCTVLSALLWAYLGPRQHEWNAALVARKQVLPLMPGISKTASSRLNNKSIKR
jgi:hypothetical protein